MSIFTRTGVSIRWRDVGASVCVQVYDGRCERLCINMNATCEYLLQNVHSDYGALYYAGVYQLLLLV